MRHIITVRNNDDLLELVRKKVKCTYISDLRKEPENTFAKAKLRKLSLNGYPLKTLNDVCRYIYDISREFKTTKEAISFMHGN